MKTLYFGGPILTMVAETDAPEALLVENGEIRALGPLRSFDSLRRVRRIDLRGRCLMPGFIDAHSHIVMNGLYAGLADLSACADFDEIVRTLRAHGERKKSKPGEPVIGFGYDHNTLREQRHPDREVLDRVSRENPVVILHVSGHMACANSRALALAGLSAATPDPEGGVIGRAPGGAEPNGYLEETAAQDVHPMIFGKAKRDIGGILRSMQRAYLEHGVTTAQDGAANRQIVTLLRLAGWLGKLKIDVVAYPMINAEGRQAVKPDPPRAAYRRHLRLGGYKLILDGSPQGRSAWMSEPYLGDDPEYRAYPYLNDDAADAFVRRAVAERRQILVHCNGDAAGEQFLNAYERALRDTGCAEDLRPVMIHCQIVRADQLARMARLRMIASIFVGHVFFWGDVHLKNFGPARANRISPAGEATRLGVPYNFHQDTPVTPPDMLRSVWCAVKRVSRSGRIVGAEMTVSPFEALRAVTAGGAYQYFEEDRKGTLQPGKLADLVVLDRNPLAVDPLEIKDIQVLETIKRGVTVYRK